VTAVHDAFARPLAVVVDRSRLDLAPTKFASVYIETAVARARISKPGANVDLVVAVHGGPLRAWVAAVEKRFARQPVDATLKLENGKPFLTKDKPGRRLDATRLTEKIVAALRGNTRLPVRVRTKLVAPSVSVGTYADVIVINRSINRLFLYRAGKLRRTFGVATGQPSYPTPRGKWHIIVKYRNPWWYPPLNNSWARGLKPVPPGPSNPLGTRWMGLDSPGVGIHGTNNPSSIGYSASHGCVRMQVRDSEWLFEHVDIGTTVFVL
jgi:lipoprotein-anchoring transpeptidase ErfK/SrfK